MRNKDPYPLRDHLSHDPYFHEDEISLYDIWAVLIRRKWIIAGITLLTFALASTYACTQEPVYDYSTVIEIGTLINGQEHTVESPQTCVAKLNNTYIPTTIGTWFQEQSEDTSLPDIKASIPGSSNKEKSTILLLTGSGPLNMRNDFFELMTEITQKLQHDHKRILERTKDQYVLDIEQARNKMACYQDDLKNLQSQVKRLQTKEELLNHEKSELEEILQNAEKHRMQAANTLTGEAEAMTLLMLSNEIRATRARISSLREQIQISLADKRDALVSEIAEKTRSIDQQSIKLKILENKLHNMVETKPLSPPQQSFRPTNTGPVMLGGLGMVLGVFGGLFGAFLVEFIRKAQEHTRSKNQD